MLGTAVATVNVPTLGDQITNLCKEHKLAAVGILYLPGGDSPQGMEGIFHPGAWQLVANVYGGGLPRGRFIVPLDEPKVAADILQRAKNLQTPAFFTAGS